MYNYLVKETDFYWKPFKTRIAKSAEINPTTTFIAEKNVRIGERCEIDPHSPGMTISEFVEKWEMIK